MDKQKKPNEPISSSSDQKTRAALDAILSSPQNENSSKEKIKPFVIEPPKNAIPIKPLPNKNIPKLDLNSKLMAEQRQFSSVKRKAPNSPSQTQNQSPTISDDLQNTSETAVERQIPSANPLITEIVAKDIQKMYQRARFQK